MSIFHVLMVAAAATMSSSPLFHTAEVLVEVTENIEYQVSDDARKPTPVWEAAAHYAHGQNAC